MQACGACARRAVSRAARNPELNPRELPRVGPLPCRARLGRRCGTSQGAPSEAKSPLPAFKSTTSPSPRRHLAAPHGPAGWLAGWRRRRRGARTRGNHVVTAWPRALSAGLGSDRDDCASASMGRGRPAVSRSRVSQSGNTLVNVSSEVS